MYDRLALKAWIWISAAASFAGWMLSLVQHLDVPGYPVFAAITVAVFCVGRAAEDRRTPKPGGMSRRSWGYHRFRRPLPLLFLILIILVFVSGVLYAPSNHMGLTYRLPRVLHWLADGHWSWVHTPDPRINDRACNNEWMIAPVLLFTRSDRALFLLNFIPFLLLPGLVFSVWTRLGVRPRAAWHWMWLMPTGYVFLIQAASVSNDAFPTVYALAGVDFALRARASRRFSDLAYSIVSIALLTGSKGSNLPLLLPWAIAFFAALPAIADRSSNRREEAPSSLSNANFRKTEPPDVGCYDERLGLRTALKGLLELIRTRPVTFVSVLLLSATISFLPTALLNIKYCGDWSGSKLETEGIAVKNRFVGIWGNGLLLLKNFVPPLFPKAKWWNEHAPDILPKAITRPMNASFERGYWGIGEIPTEEWAGIGFGISVVVVVSLFSIPFLGGPTEKRGNAAHSKCMRENPCAQVAGEALGAGPMPSWLNAILLVSPWLSLIAYATNCGMVEAPRLIAPYYPLLLPSLLISSKQSVLARKRWWRSLAFALALLALPVLIISPARPLWPAKKILSNVAAKHPNSKALARALSVYTVFGGRSDPLANVRALLPQDLKVVGFMGTEDDMPISFWRPYFHRSVENILLTDSPEYIRRRGVSYIVVSGLNLVHHGVELNDWLHRVGADLIQSTTGTVKVSDGPQPWYIVRLRDR